MSLLARLYGREIGRRNKQYDEGRAVVTFDRPVISIGNLSVGGTGKTPMVRWVIDVLQEAGVRPCIAMRGYGADRREDNKSDEAEEYRTSLGGVPVVAQPNRAEGLIELFGTEDGERVRAIVLDDGFQHRRIARQADIVLLDATRSPLEDALLPMGRLRETLGSLGRADAVVVTHSEAVGVGEVDRLVMAAKRANPSLVVAVAEHAWSGLVLEPAEESVGVEWLAQKRVLPVCGIGNPDPFLKSVGRLTRSALPAVVLRDHDPYKPGTIRRIVAEAAGAEAIVTTGKDWAKLRREDPTLWPCPVVVPKLEMRLVTGGDELRGLVLAAAMAGGDPGPDDARLGA